MTVVMGMTGVAETSMVSNHSLRSKREPSARRWVALAALASLTSLALGGRGAAQADPEVRARIARLQERLDGVRALTSMRRGVTLELDALERRLAEMEAAHAELRARLAAAEAARERAERLATLLARRLAAPQGALRSTAGAGRPTRPLVQVWLGGFLLVGLWSTHPESRRLRDRKAEAPRRRIVEV